LKKEMRGSRFQLKQMWPCEECIRRYNPTGRHNHPPTNSPVEMEFLNVRFD
jgi:hypothetical protein